MASEISVLIQGPLNPISIDSIPYYRTIGPIVLSCWNTDDIAPYSKILTEHDVQVTINPRPVDNPYRQETAYLQLMSIYHGLKNVDTPFVIRTRSDERWGNLGPLISKKNPNKIVCGNIFFRAWDLMNRHPGDHLFLGRTDWLLAAYRLLRTEHDTFREVFCMEQALALAVMIADKSEGTSKIEFSKRFDLQNINELAPFTAQYRHAGVVYENIFNDHGTIKSIEEL
jgi:hypothetical protein